MKEAAVTFVLQENLPHVLVAEEPGGHTGYQRERYFLTFRGDTFKRVPVFNCMGT